MSDSFNVAQRLVFYVRVSDSFNVAQWLVFYERVSESSQCGSVVGLLCASE